MKYSTRKMTDSEVFHANQTRESGQPFTEGVAVLYPSGLLYRTFPGTFKDRAPRWMEAVKLQLELNKGTATNPRVA